MLLKLVSYHLPFFLSLFGRLNNLRGIFLVGGTDKVEFKTLLDTKLDSLDVIRSIIRC